MAYVKEGEGALEPRELPGPPLKGGAEGRRERDEDDADAFRERWRGSFFSRELGPVGPEYSLSVAGELAASSRSSAMLLPPSPLVEAEPDTRLRDDELALMSFSFSFSFSSNPMNIRERASL